jgi:hypothetical protein
MKPGKSAVAVAMLALALSVSACSKSEAIEGVWGSPDGGTCLDNRREFTFTENGTYTSKVGSKGDRIRGGSYRKLDENAYELTEADGWSASGTIVEEKDRYVFKLHDVEGDDCDFSRPN